MADNLRRCKACGEEFPATSEFFVTLTVRKPNGTTWRGFATECRACRNKRYRPFYEANRATLIARAIKSTRKRRERPEVQEQERVGSRERKRIQLADPVGRAKHQARWAMFNAKANAPSWLTVEHKRTIETICVIAGYLTHKTGVKHEVDHYYPLTNKTCCGLHVPWNMRVITRAANKAKGNKLPT